MRDEDWLLFPDWRQGEKDKLCSTRKPPSSTNANSCVLLPGRKSVWEWGENGQMLILKEPTGNPRNQRRKRLLHDYFLLVDVQTKKVRHCQA